MFSGIIYFTLFGYFIKFCDAKKKYNNYTLYRGIPVERSHLEFFTNLSINYDVNYWIEPGEMNQAIDFVISPADNAAMLRKASEVGVYIKPITEDVQKYFDQQTVEQYTRKKLQTMNWYNFYRLDSIYNWINDMAHAHPGVVKLKSIGNSFENRSILAVQVKLNKDSYRPAVMIEGGIHAREWISPAFVTYLINQIANARSSRDAGLKKIAFDYDWYFVPILNPDGYEYSHTEDRMWRKNRRGFGIDLNRNFDYAFGTMPTDLYPVSPSYCGPYAFSEIEAKAMKRFVEEKAKYLKYYISFHSYGQYIILPSERLSSYNFNKLLTICQTAAKHLSVRYGTKYEVGTSLMTVGYEAVGVSAFWVKKEFDIPYTLLFELRDQGSYGFGLPPNLILPTCEETLDGLKIIINPTDPGELGAPQRNVWHIGSTPSKNELNKIIIVISLNLLLFIL